MRRELDPTRFRNALTNGQLKFKGHSAMVELQVHHSRISAYNHDADAHGPYEFFRTAIGGSYGPELNRILERTLQKSEHCKVFRDSSGTSAGSAQ